MGPTYCLGPYFRWIALSPDGSGASLALLHHMRLDHQAEAAFAPLAGLTAWGFARASAMLTVQFGDARALSDGDRRRTVGTYALHVSCAWRLTDNGTIAVASGDLFTPVDPDADLETFDWDVPGANWWDARMEAFFAARQAPLVVGTFVCDEVSGVRLVFHDGVELEVFPNSSPAPHVDSEYWRVLRPGEDDAHIVAGTFGLVLEQST